MTDKKMKCTSQQMLKVILRGIDRNALTPEQNLFASVIGVAISDLSDKNHRNSAEAYFSGDSFPIHCELVGIDSDAAKRLLKIGGFLPS